MDKDRTRPRPDEDPRVVEAAQTLSRAMNEGLTKIADSLDNALAGSRVTGKILREVGRQEREWGVSSWPDGTGPATRPISTVAGWIYAEATELVNAARQECDLLEAHGEVTWWYILLEEVLEAAAERPDLDNLDLDKELTQAAAVIVSWLKDRERRREQARRKRESDLAEHGYDPTEGPQ